MTSAAPWPIAADQNMRMGPVAPEYDNSRTKIIAFSVPVGRCPDAGWP